MKELLRTNDPVFLSWIQATLAEEGIEAIVFDHYTSAVEGSLVFLPRRVMVLAEDFERARRVIDAAKPGALP